MTKKGPRRWLEQRWIIDNIIRSVGPEWDQGRVNQALAAVGTGLMPEANALRANVKKFNDISREYERLARARESRANEAERSGHIVSARESCFAASILYGFAAWPILEDDNPKLLELTDRKNACYDKYIQFASHRIERVEIPFEGKSLTGLLHLPATYQSGKKLPALLSISGMDSFKELRPALYGDRFLEREIAVLAIDGPGQGDSLIKRKIRVTPDNFDRAGSACVDYLLKRDEIDRQCICGVGVSMGSYWLSRVIAHDGRFLAGAVALTCLEPGMETIFNSASPTFKFRFMWMTGVWDEDEFDALARRMSLEGIGAKINVPFLIVGGEDDDLSPVEFTYHFYDSIVSPKTLIVYEGERHSIQNPYAMDEVADWIRDRVERKPLRSERIRVERTGKRLFSNRSPI